MLSYVKFFDVLGVETAQIPCIELQGAPTAATEGVVGLLGMDVTSETYELYKCVKVEGSVYTWKSITRGEDGTSLTNAEVDINGDLILSLSNGTTINVGKVKGEKGADGVNGIDGVDGVGVKDVVIDEDGGLVVTLSNGDTINAGKVKGEQGVSITNAELNANYEFIITLSNDTIINLGNIHDGAISKLKCYITGDTSNVAFITTDKYNELEAAGTLPEDTACFIIDDTTLDDLGEQLKALNRSITQLGSGLNAITNGTTAVGKTNGINGKVVYEGAASFSNAISANYPNRTIAVKLEVGYRYLFITPHYNSDAVKVMLEGIAYSTDTNNAAIELMASGNDAIYTTRVTGNISTGNTNLQCLMRYSGETKESLNKHLESIKVIRLEKVFDD